jgi:hypothetical protein
MSNFPLYTTLMKNISKKDLTILQKNDFINRVKTLDSEGYHLIYALIKSFSLENEKTDSFILPYNGKLAKDRIDFNLEDLPNTLKQLLYKFITIHQEKIIQDIK